MSAVAILQCPCGRVAAARLVDTDGDLGGTTVALEGVPEGWLYRLEFIESPSYDEALDGERRGQTQVRCPEHSEELMQIWRDEAQRAYAEALRQESRKA